MNACEDFFELVTKAHILAATMTIFEMRALTDSFPIEGVTSDTLQNSQSAILESIAAKIT